LISGIFPFPLLILGHTGFTRSERPTGEFCIHAYENEYSLKCLKLKVHYCFRCALALHDLADEYDYPTAHKTFTARIKRNNNNANKSF